MSEVPERAEVLLSDNIAGRFPIVNVNNVYILPGVPAFLKRGFRCFLDVLDAANLPPAPKQAVVYVNLDEVSFTNILNSAVKYFDSRVKFGSYPEYDKSYYLVRITLESDSEKDLMEGKQYLENHLPAGSVIDFDSDPTKDAPEKLERALKLNKLGKQLETHLSASLDVITDCLTNRYDPLEVCLSFNGGKDCTASLHLYHAVLTKLFPDSKKPITALYIQSENPFPEVEEFVNESVQRYNLKICTLKGPIKQGLKDFKEANPNIKAILMGNRRTDPNSKDLQAYKMTDADWPSVMRVFPILDWSYSDVWSFIRCLQLPYCPLYDKGYTSLGNASNTKQNPHLQWIDGLGNVRYRPAYELNDASSERNGRK